jgi:heme oxygenase (biliverdin-IX-beta and delta-forming)
MDGRAVQADTLNRSSAHARLRSATRVQHARIERELDLLSATLTAERYRAVLRAFLGFYAPLEDRWTGRDRALAAIVPFALLPRAPALRDDLRALGVPKPEIDATPRCPHVPSTETLPQLAGCLYVIEGASLGGQIVARAVSRRFGYRHDSGAGFFGLGSPRTRWPNVLAWLETVAEHEPEREATVAAARATFDALSRWTGSQVAAA